MKNPSKNLYTKTSASFISKIPDLLYSKIPISCYLIYILPKHQMYFWNKPILVHMQTLMVGSVCISVQSDPLCYLYTVQQRLWLAERPESLLSVYRIFFHLGFTSLSRIFHLYRANRSSKVGENWRTRGENHMTICKHNLAFPHVTRARLEPQWWETEWIKSQLSYPLGYRGPHLFMEYLIIATDKALFSSEKCWYLS